MLTSFGLEIALSPSKEISPMPAVRRVYLHIPNNFAELQEKLEQAEQRLAEKTTECENLRADYARLAAKNLAYCQKNAELSVQKADLMNE